MSGLNPQKSQNDPLSKMTGNKSNTTVWNNVSLKANQSLPSSQSNIISTSQKS